MKIKELILGVVTTALLFATGSGANMAMAYTCESGVEVRNPAACAQQEDERTVGGSILKIINLVTGILGVVAVIVIIVGGIQYVLSTGDAGKVAHARDTILYGVIGLIIAVVAFAIVNFVLSSIFGGATGETAA